MPLLHVGVLEGLDSHSSTDSLLVCCRNSFEPNRATFSDSLTLSSRTCGLDHELIMHRNDLGQHKGTPWGCKAFAYQLQVSSHRVIAPVLAAAFYFCEGSF